MTPVCITLDVDWAPEAAIALAAERLAASGVRATWFLTHPSPEVERLRADPGGFELGIHPNFLPGSSHGATVPEVLRYCLSLVPEAVSMRTHGLFQSGQLLDEVLATTGITTDSSMFIPGAWGVQPFRQKFHSGTLTRVPFIWADDYKMLADGDSPLAAPDPADPGVQVYLFHPIHIALNTRNHDHYRRFRRAVGDTAAATADDLRRHRYPGYGIANCFEDLVAHLRDHGGGHLLRTLACP